MGSSASKTAGAAARQYPKRSPPTSNPSTIARSPQPAQSGPTVKPAPSASTTRDAAINADASDPDLARNLRNLGPVRPNPTYSRTSTFDASTYGRPQMPSPRANPAIMILEARSKLQEQADKEFSLAGGEGRQFLDAYTLRQILLQRDEEGRSATDIEKDLGLKAGVVARLGPRGMLGLVKETGRARKEVDLV